MGTRRWLPLLEQLFVMAILWSTAASMHLVIFQKISECRSPAEHQVEFHEVPEVLIVTDPDVRVSSDSETQNNAVKLWFSKFPPFIERIVQIIQNRFSTYNNVGTYPEVVYEDPYSSTTSSPSPTTTTATTITIATSTTSTTTPASSTSSSTTAESDLQTQDGEDSGSEGKL